MFDDVYIYVPGEQQIIKISEGSGDNLTDEDELAGYVDYIYYEQYSRESGIPEVDGGAVLDMAYGDETIDYIVLD